MIRQILVALFAITSLTVQCHAGTWNLPTPVKETKADKRCGVEIDEGPFHLKAKLKLKSLNGTAAGVRIGDDLLFGFDARSGGLFIEGRAAGKTQTLDTPNPIEAGKAFQFDVRRDSKNQTTFKIDGKEVFTTKKLTGAIEHITFRPLRNHMDILAVTVTGKLREPTNEVHAEQRIIPVLNDGSNMALLDLNIRVKKDSVLKQVRLNLSGTTDLTDIQKLTLFRSNGKQQRQTGTEFGTTETASKVTTLDGSVDLTQGSNHFWVAVQIKPGADLLHTVAVAVESITLEGGHVMRPKEQNTKPMRLAYAIHKRGQHNCHTFRIPGLAKANDGSLLAVFDMRYNSSRDLQEHMDIGLARSTDGGQTWSPPVPIMDMGEFGGKPQKENGCSDPGIIVDTATGEIIVTACWTHGKPNTHQWSGKGSEPGLSIDLTTQFMAVRSTDNGLTWSEPENWTAALKDPSWYLFAPAPGNGITMSDGTLVIPTQGRDETGRPFSNITWSKDHGKTWHVSSHARDNTTECAVAEISNGSLILSMRDNRNRSMKGDDNGRAVGVTRDLGKTWKKHPADHGALPEPVCMASLISFKHPRGKHLLFFSNPHNKHHRRDMTIQMSTDDGKSWPEKYHVLLDQGGGFGYSNLVIIDDDTVGIVYESSVADMTFQMVPMNDFVQSK